MLPLLLLLYRLDQRLFEVQNTTCYNVLYTYNIHITCQPSEVVAGMFLEGIGLQKRVLSVEHCSLFVLWSIYDLWSPAVLYTGAGFGPTGC